MADSESVEKKEAPSEKNPAVAASMAEAAERKPEDERGPAIYLNWLSWQQDKPLISTQEYPLYTDSHIVAETKHGPYEFLNTVSAVPGVVRPGVILRYEWHWVFPHPDFSRTNADRYHGGSPADEIAALSSLAMGVRFRAGDSTRSFEPEGDPKGRPTALTTKNLPVLTKHPFRKWVIPRVANGEHSLELLKVLEILPALNAEAATALIRAARLYQDALWLAESEPALAWLLLVSCLETAANHWHAAQEDALARLETAKPSLCEELCKYDPALARRVADEFKDSFGATRKFIDFVMKFRPPEPANRPPWAAVDWSDASIKRILKIVYDYRSKALHGGKPFPAPMCEGPYMEKGWTAATEKPHGHVSMSGGVWLEAEIPILLNTFEYIARETLLNWWNAQAPRE